MKRMIQLMTCAVAATMSMEVAMATLNIPSDGSDGALVVSNNLVIDLSQAVTGSWDTNNTANAGKGVYDASKWAVVFKYSNVTIQGGATLTFKNHASRAPVVWLVQSNVTINGALSLDGESVELNSPYLAEPGPGGFRGGMGRYAEGAGAAPGFGPDGGDININNLGWSGPGWYSYGNPSLIPLIGGSGGGGTGGAAGGGAGGGAILIASAGTISMSGYLHANGGSSRGGTGGGSGGGIRLVCDSLSGGGTMQCIGVSNGGYTGGMGRIRIERSANTYAGIISPDPNVLVYSGNTTPLIWMPTNGPSLRIVSINGNTAPEDPRAGFGAIGADVVLPQVTNATVVMVTTNIQQASVLTVRATPRSDGHYTTATATVTEVISESEPVLIWTANVPVKDGYEAMQVRAVRP